MFSNLFLGNSISSPSVGLFFSIWVPQKSSTTRLHKKLIAENNDNDDDFKFENTVVQEFINRSVSCVF